MFNVLSVMHNFDASTSIVIMKKETCIQLEAVLERYGQNGDKSGWTYVQLAAETVTRLTDERRSFKICGSIDEYSLKQVAVIPVGEGDFILPVNAIMRRAIGKKEGDKVVLSFSIDSSEVILSAELMETLSMDGQALHSFQQLTPGHQQYFSKWVESAKTATTKADRLAKCLYAMQYGLDYGQMIRHFKKK
jgi:uncharacterized protein YdeI (YjbR/CyaY-like superfamily)